MTPSTATPESSVRAFGGAGSSRHAPGAGAGLDGDRTLYARGVHGFRYGGFASPSHSRTFGPGSGGPKTRMPPAAAVPTRATDANVTPLRMRASCQQAAGRNVAPAGWHNPAHADRVRLVTHGHRCEAD